MMANRCPVVNVHSLNGLWRHVYCASRGHPEQAQWRLLFVRGTDHKAFQKDGTNQRATTLGFSTDDDGLIRL